MSTDPSSKSLILIVDDMEDNLIALEAVLDSRDQVVRARSGEEALKAMLRQDFAVVLLDVFMPGMDGFETVANIKRLDQTRDVPVILLTGADAAGDFAYRGYSVGAADFLTKPVDPWLLRTKVNVFLELHRNNRQLTAQAEQLRRLLVRETDSPNTIKPPTTGATTQSGIRKGSGCDAEDPFPASEATTANDEDSFAEIIERLNQIELLLREAKGDAPVGLADRITSLEQAVESLHRSRSS
ncbi:two-component system response regulator [Streptomyces sp. NPDC101151]|uniref:response regulator n=1 Tax=Streptomyces sp. NPDC101151 TaxID=3366115 RepID=UPI003824C538